MWADRPLPAFRFPRPFGQDGGHPEAVRLEHSDRNAPVPEGGGFSKFVSFASLREGACGPSVGWIHKRRVREQARGFPSVGRIPEKEIGKVFSGTKIEHHVIHADRG